MKVKELNAIVSHARAEAEKPEADVQTVLLANLVVLSAEQLLQLSSIKQILSEEIAQRIEGMTRAFAEFDDRVSGRMAIIHYDTDEEGDDEPEAPEV